MDAERDFIENFIACYESHPALWDVTSEEYLAKDSKEEGYQDLLKVYQQIKKKATIDDVKRKLNSLRSSYRRELKKIKQTGTSGCVTLWWFPLMSFLQYDELPTSSPKDITAMEECDDFIALDNIESDLDEFIISHKEKKRKTTKRQGTKKSTEWKHSSKPEDNFERMSKTWADKLRKMTRNQSLIAEKIINDTIFEGEMGFLSIETIAKNNYSVLPTPVSISCVRSVRQPSQNSLSERNSISPTPTKNHTSRQITSSPVRSAKQKTVKGMH